ncbi:MAG: tetratricopeptide repeat protein [Atopobiaceae bacterium]|nr:tetratricopeptide repeat protein [Atopobiaceae bacterium]
MTEKGPGSTGRSSNKRLARAKIKTTENGIKSSKGRKDTAAQELSRAEEKAARKKKITAIAVGIFAVVMALSMMLPSLTYIFGNKADQQQEQQEQTKKDESETSEEEEETQEEQTATGIDAVDKNYKAVIDPLESKLEKNPEDLATLLSLGNDYMAWASEASSYATDEAGQTHVSDLFNKAIDYYDRYLALNDSAVVKANKAMCLMYNGDTDGALAALQALTKESPDYGPAWANIGLIYEYQGDQDKAKEAYQKAIEADPDDEYGAKSYANRRLAAIAASAGEGLTDEAADSTSGSSASSTGAQALEDALGSNL